MKIQVSSKVPTELGKYVFVGKFLKEPEIITVVKYPARFEYGRHWDEYLGVAESRGRHISHFNGYFSERIDSISLDYGQELYKTSQV